MTRELVDRIADAVLYEGYLLYPYRPSVKNRQRWTFGGLLPPSYCESQEGAESSWAQTQCVVQAGSGARLSVRVRFLHLQLRRRQVGEGQLAWPADPQHPAVWQEAVEREVESGEVDLAELIAQPRVLEFAFPAQTFHEPWVGARGETLGKVVREQRAVAGAVELSASPVAERIVLVTVRIANRTESVPASSESDRDDALRQALVSTHTILNIRDGEFVSMVDPPESCREPVARCKNVGAWPVLIGETGERDTMLSAPIILYDYPEIAPESPGDLFDATEIDEILTLRILTLTDEEKQAVAAVDPRARALLERTESVAQEEIMRLHGTMRNVRPLLARGPMQGDPFELGIEENRPRLQSIRVGNVELRVGDRVRIWPLGDADIFDIALKGKTAAIEAIEQDFEDRIHVAVTVDDDPGRDLGAQGKPGHRFFFRPEELEPLDDSGGGGAS